MHYSNTLCVTAFSLDDMERGVHTHMLTMVHRYSVVTCSCTNCSQGSPLMDIDLYMLFDQLIVVRVGQS